MVQKHIAFFINNRVYSDLDCRRIVDGNPGIGGSEYMKILISYFLTIRENDIDVTVFVTQNAKFPVELKIEQVSNLTEAVQLADSRNMDYVIFDYNPQNMRLVEEIFPKHLRFITWCHNFASLETLDKLAKDNRYFKIITVGREQKDIYRDHPAFYKSEFIYYCANIKSVSKYNVSSFPILERKNVVTYIGAINRYKGFHRLAQAWPKIVSEIPDAELYVIGAGNLYDKNATLGKWGIADENYENYFMQFLTKGDKILDNVHFMGIMGEEKNSILLKTKVGVPNPTGASETFCISALEMQLMGASIVSKEYVGYLDTVLTGILVKNYSDLANCIIKELRSPHDNYDRTIEEIKQRFSTDVVIKDWEELIITGEINRDEELVNKSFRYKWLKEKLRLLKQKYQILKIIPPVEYFISIYYRHFYSRYMRLLGKKNIDYIDTF